MVTSKSEEALPQKTNEVSEVSQSKHVEDIVVGNLVYENTEEEPQLSIRTYLAIFSMFLLNMSQIVALQSVPTVLSFIGKAFNEPNTQTWIANSTSLVQAALCPAISSASDHFQARKMILVVACLISFIGCAIAPGSESIYRLIVAQTVIGAGFSCAPLTYAIPSEILPRRWRPLGQAFVNIGAVTGGIIGPVVIGAFTRQDLHDGWRKFWWFQMALWGATALVIFLAYKPPKRHTKYDHLSFIQKLGRLDLPGTALLTTGLTLLLTGLNLGGALYPWTNSRVLATLVTGIFTLVLFGLYEWKIKTGILHHDLFTGGKTQGRTFIICLILIFFEGLMGFSYSIYYPIINQILFETDPLLLAVRNIPFWAGVGLSTIPWGYASARFRTIRVPLILGFLIFTGALVGFATIRPGDNVSAIAFSAMNGIGFGAPLILLVVGVQLSTPHALIATATALMTSSRAIAVSTFVAIYNTAANTRLASSIPERVGQAALADGLPVSSLGPLLEALTSGNTTALGQVPGVSPSIIASSAAALQQAYAYSFTLPFIIAAPFGVVAIIACLFLGDLQSTMNYRVDAPIENLHARHHH